MTRRFSGKGVIVTGSGKGIGKASALAFAREGAGVAVADRSLEDAEQTAAAISAEGGRAIAVACDVTQTDDVRRLVATTANAFGGVDVLHNNAGVIRYGTVVDMSEEDWDFVLNVNLRATFLTCKHVIPEMRRRGGGAIVNTSSVQAFASQRTVAAYSASKGAVLSLTRTIALDHAGENIRCNCIAPGSVHTPMLDQAAHTFAADNPAGAIADWGRLHPLGRVGTPEEVAKLVLFLAGDDASFCTGGCYTIDGGLLASLM